MTDAIETEEIEKLRRRLEMLELIFESIHNGAMVTDTDGIITHFNKPYGQFLGLDPEAQIGRPPSPSPSRTPACTSWPRPGRPRSINPS